LRVRSIRDRVLGVQVAFALWTVTLGAFGCARVSHQTGAGGQGGGETGFAGIGGQGLDAGVGGSAGTMSTFDAAIELPPPTVCGNSVVEPPENCDDGNAVSGDGCSSSCFKEPNFDCATPGKRCTHVVVCGDHMIEGTEACDDGNTVSGDGCSMTCTLECGWECPPGTLCRAAKCGDGMVAGNEQCDDGNTVDGDGCSAICGLESRPPAEPEGWACASPTQANGCAGPTACAKTTCGNKMKEGSEQCDDGNTVTGKGCSPFCRLEPICPQTGGPCKTACGDGLLLATDTDQECDDGNTVSGDGCSSDCKIEPGYTCPSVVVSPNPLILPVVYHDFKGWNEGDAVHDHPDFQNYQGDGKGRAGIAQTTLGTANGGVPVHVPMCVPLTTNLCMPGGANPTWDPAVDWFGMWYVDNPTYNKTIVSTLTLPQIAGGAFQYTKVGNAATGLGFFPINGMGWGNTPGYTLNYGFTSAVRYWFQYSGAANLTFVGDDDVWVYVNKKLAVDLGGTHQEVTGSITLDAADGTGYACDFVAPGTGGGACDPVAKTGGHIVDVGLVLGSVYEIVVFQAERFTTESNYQLTLSNFSGKKSVCASKCGDGVVTPPEICDLGTATNTGAYGGCNPDCTLAPYCGDKIVNGNEECDSSGNCDKNCKKLVVQ
jgi:fibro-slime domain-containing protein